MTHRDDMPAEQRAEIDTLEYGVWEHQQSQDWETAEEQQTWCDEEARLVQACKDWWEDRPW